MVNKIVSDLDTAPAVTSDMYMLVENSTATYKATVANVSGARIDDNTVSTTTTYSSSKIDSIVGDIETLLSEV